MKKKPVTESSSLPSFPKRLLQIAGILTCCMLLWFCYASYDTHGDLIMISQQDMKLAELKTQILLHEEVSNSSALLSLITGEKIWQTRNEQQDKFFGTVFDTLCQTSASTEICNLSKKLSAIDHIKDSIEHKSFDLVNQGKMAEAKKLMLGSLYLDQSKLFETTLQQLNSSLEPYTRYYLDEAMSNTYYLTIGSMVFLIFLIFIWWIGYTNFIKWKKALTYALRKELMYKDQIKKANERLDQRVTERTSELKETNKALSATLDSLHSTQSQLIESEKMSITGQLAAGVAHEINNPLSYVSNNIDVLNKRFLSIHELYNLYQNLINKIQELHVPQLQEMTAQINTLSQTKKISNSFDDLPALMTETLEGLKRIKDIVLNLRSFSSPEDEELSDTDLNSCIESAIELSRNELKYKCTLHKNFSTLPTLRSKPRQLKIVFINLLLNAADAINDKGDITIVTSATYSDITISITDTGRGIPPEQLRKLFTPFFTTKEKSAGLGLSTAYGIIHSLGGSITASSTLNHGATFTISFPLNNPLV